MAHRDLHGTTYQPGPTQVILVLLLISKAARAKLQRKFKAINMSMTNRMTFSCRTALAEVCNLRITGFYSSEQSFDLEMLTSCTWKRVEDDEHGLKCLPLNIIIPEGRCS